MKISFSPPYIDDAVIDEVVDTLNSGWITTGPKVKALENEICSFTNSQAVLCVNSWTSGAIMMLRWLGPKSGDEVIVPAYTYCATALAVLNVGAVPVMVDISDDFNISLEAIKKAITPKTKAIISVDIAGWPCDYNELVELVTQKEVLELFVPTSKVQTQLGRILLLSDAAHSLGAKYNGKNIGNEVDVTIFSLHAVKNITTAEGGAICLNLPKPFDNLELYKELRMMSLNCQTKDAFSKSKSGSWKYDVIGFGMKINLPDVNAAIGLAQIRQYNNLLQLRKSISERYQQSFSLFDWAILPPQKSSFKESSYHIYALRFKSITEDQRDEIILNMTKQDVAINVHFIPLPMLSFFLDMGYSMDNFPLSLKNYSCELSLPIYSQMKDEEVDFVIKTVIDSYEKVVLKK